MQLVLVLETRASCESDYRYIKSAIDFFYIERSFKLTKIFANNKTELIKQEKKISECKNKYNGETVVVICADYDRESDTFNNQLSNYCADNCFELVWMNLDVEEVFLGKQIPNRLKNKESINFLKRKDFLLSSIQTLNAPNPTTFHPASNLLIIIDKYLKRKT